MAACVAWPAEVAPFHVLSVSLVYPAYYIGGSLWLGGLARSG
jgi:hypothetical protein